MLAEEDMSIEKLMAQGKYELAKKKLEVLSVNGKLPYYLDRPYFQTKTYTTYNEAGFDQAYELNQLTKEFFPDDPVVSIVDFELHQYNDDAIGQFTSVFPVIGKLLKRYYLIVTTDRVMNDQYNAFIGR